MGNGAAIPTSSLTAFKEACDWHMDNCSKNAEDTLAYLQNKVDHILINEAYHKQIFSDECVRKAESTSLSDQKIKSSPENQSYSTILDSLYIKSWLSKSDADVLYNHLVEKGKNMMENMKRMQEHNIDIKYPLSTITYGAKRSLDGALALDRWGSYHESWCRVEEPSHEINNICQKMREFFHLPLYALNSIVVNYYWDGDSTHIPAHRDTINCLEDNSKIHCLSLGATRDFILCDNDDSGKYIQEDMTIYHSYAVQHGDLFALGPYTNKTYCHSVPKDTTIKTLRISIIFRTVTKSFIDFNPVTIPLRNVTYASGKEKSFQAECILCDSIEDNGVRTHIVDLISTRETKKKEKLQNLKVNISNKTSTTSRTTTINNNNNNDSTAVMSDVILSDDEKKLLDTTPTMTNTTTINTSTINASTDVQTVKNSSSRKDFDTNTDIDTDTSHVNYRMCDDEIRKQYFMGDGYQVPTCTCTTTTTIV